MSEQQLDYSRDFWLPLRSLWRNEPLTFWFTTTAIVVNVLMAILAVADPEGWSEPIAILFSPCLNWLLGAIGVLLLLAVYNRSSSTVFCAHAVLAIGLPWIMNHIVWQLACMASPY